MEGVMMSDQDWLDAGMEILSEEGARALTLDRLTQKLGLSTDCGLINLPRMISAGKLRALADGAEMVRKELRAKQS